MSLQAVGLLHLAAIGQADVVDAEVGLIIVMVRRDLAWKRSACGEEAGQRGGGRSPQYCWMTLRSVRMACAEAVAATAKTESFMAGTRCEERDARGGLRAHVFYVSTLRCTPARFAARRSGCYYSTTARYLYLSAGPNTDVRSFHVANAGAELLALIHSNGCSTK